MDNIYLVMPKSWNLMIRADRVNWNQYTLMASLDPVNSGLIDETLEKTCLFHHEEADGIGLISALLS